MTSGLAREMPEKEGNTKNKTKKMAVKATPEADAGAAVDKELVQALPSTGL